MCREDCDSGEWEEGGKEGWVGTVSECSAALRREPVGTVPH